VEGDELTSGYYGIWLIENPTNGNCYLPGSEGGFHFDDMITDVGNIYNSSDWYQDTMLIVARSCGTAALLIGFLCWATMFIGMCCSCELGGCFRKTMGMMAVLCAVLAGLQFLILRSEFLCDTGEDGVTCSLSIASTLNIISVCVYTAAGILLCMVPDDD